MHGLGHVVGPLVGELLGVDLDRGGVLGEDGRAELAGQVGGLAGQCRPSAAGGHGADLGQLPVAFLLQGVGGFPFGRDVGLILRELVRGGVPALLTGPCQDFILGGAGRGPLVPELVDQVRHGPTSSISNLNSRDCGNGSRLRTPCHLVVLG
jgi:hypothetical protein